MEDKVEQYTLLDPWIYGPYELIQHAEEHLKANGDFDRRMALISYDNAIEISISTFLSLHKKQRAGINYSRKQVEAWLENYHTRLDFFFDEYIKSSGLIPAIDRGDLIHYHDLRNNLYHEGKNLVPTERDIKGVRAAALYIFSTLFNVNGEQILLDSPALHETIIRKIKINGKGSDIHKIHLKVGSVIFRIKYRGSGRPTINLSNEDNRVIAKLVSYTETAFFSDNRTHTFNKTANIKVDGAYLLEVSISSGAWEIEIEQ